MTDYKPEAHSVTTTSYPDLVKYTKEQFFYDLAMLQGEITPIKKEQPGNFGKFASLDAITAVLRPLLKQHGFSISFKTEIHSENKILLTCELNKNGVFITSVCPIIMNDNPQKVGGALTYYKRYLVQGILNICAEDEDDGDSFNKSSKAANTSQGSVKVVPPTSPNSNDVRSGGGFPKTISEPQRKRLWAIATKAGHNEDSLKEIVKEFGYESSKDITMDDYEAVCAEAEHGPVSKN